MASAESQYFCHKCQRHIGHVSSQNFRCPRCRDDFIEEISPNRMSNHSHRSQPRPNRLIRFRAPGGLGNSTIVLGGGGDNQTVNNDTPDVGVFFQTILQQIAGGGNPNPSFAVHNNGNNQGSLNAFLAQFLTQMVDHGGPAPASESGINSIPTVKITREQARESLQCTICMEDFSAYADAKRLPCSHHFHEECISRWLRLHGTCPTCRVTLDGNNPTNQEYHNLYPNEQQPNSRNNNNHRRRHDRGNAGSTLYDFE